MEAATTRTEAWVNSNLAVQGYCLTAEESRALRVGLRFPTALCLALVVTGLALQSAALILALVPIGAVAGWTQRQGYAVKALRHVLGLRLHGLHRPPSARACTDGRCCRARLPGCSSLGNSLFIRSMS